MQGIEFCRYPYFFKEDFQVVNFFPLFPRKRLGKICCGKKENRKSVYPFIEDRHNPPTVGWGDRLRLLSSKFKMASKMAATLLDMN